MATAAPVYEERRMSVGRVFQRAFSAISLNPIVILGLALLVGALPALLMTYVFAEMGLTSQASLQNGLSFGRIIGASLITSMISLIVATLVQAALTRATVTAAEGRRATFGESLAAALPVIFPLIGLSILFAIGIGIGFVLLFVPGIILMLMWAVAVPALVVERHGVFAAFGRSAELTKGARWRVLGLFLVLVVIYWLLSLVVGIFGLGMYSPATGLTLGSILGTVIVQTIVNALWGTIQPSLYVELRQWKEGDSVQNLAEVFA
jgi:hypothetical protein